MVCGLIVVGEIGQNQGYSYIGVHHFESSDLRRRERRSPSFTHSLTHPLTHCHFVSAPASQRLTALIDTELR